MLNLYKMNRMKHKQVIVVVLIKKKKVDNRDKYLDAF